MARKLKPRHPLGKREIAKREKERHMEAEATRLLREHERIKQQATEAVNEKLREAYYAASAPRNTDLLEEHRRLVEFEQHFEDWRQMTGIIRAAVDENGTRGAFFGARRQSDGFWHQFLSGIAMLWNWPVSTTFVAKVKTAKKIGN